MSSPSQFKYDEKCMLRAIELSKNCSVPRVYSVGCVIVDAQGCEMASGFTGEISYDDASMKSAPHAEEIALGRLPKSAECSKLTLYSSLEPCSERASGLESCCSRIIASQVGRVVFGAKEPFDHRLRIICRGVETLRAAGVEVLHFEQLNDLSLSSARRVAP